MSYQGKRYRGRLVLYLNDRGSINVVNQLHLDDYLRGVLPREMGPELYPRIEALKALAVAARTYALHNLGEFEAEGYDICATPRCQVYGGLGGEHPVSDQAVRETAGLVLLHEHWPADTLYSASCGGHTEDVQIVFPLKREPYLAGVSCFEAGITRLAGSALSQPLETWLLDRVVGRAPSAPGSRLHARLASLTDPDRSLDQATLESLDAAAIHRQIAAAFDLVLDPILLRDLATLRSLTGERAQYSRLERLPVEERHLAYSLPAIGPSMSSGDVDRLSLLLAVRSRRLERLETTFLARRADGRLRVRMNDRGVDLALDPGFVTVVAGQEFGAVSVLRSPGTGPSGSAATAGPGPRTGALTLRAGDPLELFAERTSGGLRVLAVVASPSSVPRVEVPNRAWSRQRSLGTLRSRVARRYPGFELADIRLLDRGVSDRVRAIDLVDSRGETLRVEGLAIRWTLDLPDTRFRMSKSSPGGGQTIFSFRGSGHGHGVGLCQIGSFLMADRGHGYESILRHYYTGLALRDLRPSRAREISP